MILAMKAAGAYFGIVFGVGFLLGMIRVPFLVPLLGQRTSELIELPFMLAAIFFSARWIATQYSLSGRTLLALGIGILAASLLLLVEFSVVLWIRGLTLSEFFADRDPIAGAFYYIAVAVFALMPAIMSTTLRRSDRNG